MTMLFDFYGEILTERQKEFFDLYYTRISLWARSPRTAASPVRASAM
jgi:hypothetical protein